MKSARLALLGANGKDAILDDPAQTMFDREYEDDIVALAPCTAKDALTQFIKKHWRIERRQEEVSFLPTCLRLHSLTRNP